MQLATVSVRNTYKINLGRCTRDAFPTSIGQRLFSDRIAPKLTHHRSLASYNRTRQQKSGPPITEDKYHLPAHSSQNNGRAPVSIIDTHTHLLATFEVYKRNFPEGEYNTYHDFVKGFYKPPSTSRNGPVKHSVDALINVWCEAPINPDWKKYADSALDREKRKALWGDVDYWFVMGVHPHNAAKYTDNIHKQIIQAMEHPRCVGWGEIGLDYHYGKSRAEVQKSVLRRQLREATSLGKPVTIHTREADEDIEVILKEELPKDHKIHVHCFTDSPSLARALLDHFPNLCIGITGVITYGSNLNTSETIRGMIQDGRYDSTKLRILLETDAPYMVPANIGQSLAGSKSTRLAFSHSGMIPWTAEFVADLVNKSAGVAIDANDVLAVSRANTRLVYGV